MKMSKHIIDKVISWAEKRNIIKGCEPIDQYIKLVEEFGELGQALADGYKIGDNNKSKEHLLFKDSIGDCMVVAIILREQLEIKHADINDFYAKYNNAYPSNAQISITTSNRAINYLLSLVGQLGKLIKKQDYGNALYAIDRIWGSLLILENSSSNRYSLPHAYNEIKNRDGIMINGTFIKSDDYSTLSDSFLSSHGFKRDYKTDNYGETKCLILPIG